MNFLLVSFILTALLLESNGQYNNYENERSEEESQYNFRPKTPPPQILSHKQALNHDGNFKYAFAADNGLAQGESIAPDGTRTGGYTYVDPNGKKISVKYTAGKEGFRILEGDHVPKAPPHSLIAEQSRGLYISEPSQYRPEAPVKKYSSISPQKHYEPQIRASYTIPKPSFAPSNDLTEEKEFDYQDEPGKAHSFGTGYVFEFSG